MLLPVLDRVWLILERLLRAFPVVMALGGAWQVLMHSKGLSGTMLLAFVSTEGVAGLQHHQIHTSDSWSIMLCKESPASGCSRQSASVAGLQQTVALPSATCGVAAGLRSGQQLAATWLQHTRKRSWSSWQGHMLHQLSTSW